MFKRHLVTLAIVTLLIATCITSWGQAGAPLSVQASAVKGLPSVVILATGGTIAGAQPKEGDAGYKSGSISIESLMAAAPGMDKLARVTGELTPDWLAAALAATP